jgi:hypothetical protein
LSRDPRAGRGLTLIEAVVTIAVVSVIGLSAAAIMMVAAKAELVAVNLGDSVDAGTLASQRISLELREMLAPASIGLVGSTPSTTELAFLAPDPSGNGTNDEIHYRLSTTTTGRLVRIQNGGAEQPLAEGVTSFTVTYRADGGAATTTEAFITRIDFAFDIARGGQTLHFGGQVFPRALGLVAVSWREQ